MKTRTKTLSIKKLNNLATSYFVSGHIIKNEYLCISAFISFVASQRNIPTLSDRRPLANKAKSLRRPKKAV